MLSLKLLNPLPQNERRRAPRYLVSPETPLVVGVATLDGPGRPCTFTGRARDLSDAGIAVVLPPDETCAKLTEQRCSLVAVVSLPTGAVALRGEAVYCDRSYRGAAGEGYVIGIRFTEAEGRDHALLRDFLQLFTTPAPTGDTR